MSTSTHGAAAGVFTHPALLYEGPAEYLAGTVQFIEDGLGSGEPVLVAVPGPNLGLLRDALGAAATEVHMQDMTVAGRNPGRIIPGVLLPFAEAHAGKPVRIIGEPVWPGRDPMEYPACVQHEALINTAFADRDATILCPYDVAGLDQQRIDDAYRTHPVMATAITTWHSPRYHDPVAVAAGCNLPLPDPPPGALAIALGKASLRAVRHFVAEHAASAGLGPERATDLALAVNELAANTMAHTAGTGTLTVWTENGAVVCQIRDTGHITNPLAGRIPPRLDGPPGGRGLLLVNHLCDLVRIHTQPQATTVRVHMRG